MLNLKGYRIQECLYQGNRTEVYRAIREADQNLVVIKKLRNDYPQFNELVQFRHQYVLTKNLEIPGIVKPLGIEHSGNGYLLVMEDTQGVSLLSYVEDHPLSLETFLEIAIALCQILENLYHHRIIHKDIKPANILINPQTKEIKLIDFSIASRLPKENQSLQNPNVLEGTLAYIAPEQTGRMNRGLDYRSDFYSLGVTFYQLLTGELPFNSDDPMELIHCHLAKNPQPPHLVNPKIPQLLADLVLKLMAKTAESRYQSPWGIRHDLEKCLEAWRLNQTIPAFELGQYDICDRFSIPEKLYGREKEVQILLDAFERVAKSSETLRNPGKSRAEMMLVGGFSGIGKTAVVNEIHKPIVRQRGYFIAGKFDQFNRNIPFSGFVQAFRDLMGQLLGESNEKLSVWRSKILAALGEQAQVIIEVIPELESIIGPQPPVAQLSGSAAQSRFNLILIKFVGLFATSAHPLVIFLDDLQWIDSASLQAIELLINQQDQYLFLIGAYRDNEVTPAHPLMLTVEKIKTTTSSVNSLILGPLTSTDLTQLIADTLGCSHSLATPFSQLVEQKTQGNPLFVTQFLNFLYTDGLIQFNRQTNSWQCDLSQVRELSLTDDVLEFMVLQVKRLPDLTQNILKLAACIGNQFDLEKLAIVSEKSPHQIAQIIWAALESGLVIPLTKTYKFFLDEVNEADLPENSEFLPNISYKFLHDRVQQAAYVLIPDAEKQATHLTIGQLLLEKIPAHEQSERILEIVNQLNLGKSLLRDRHELNQLAHLNLRAGRKAKLSTAYGAAIAYFTTGIELLAGDSWETAYELNLALYESAAEANCLVGDFVSMTNYINAVMQQAKTLLDRLKVYETKSLAYIFQNHPLKAVNLGLSFLEKLGITFPEQPTQDDNQKLLQSTTLNLKNIGIENLVNLPVMTDLHQKSAIRILLNIASPAYQTNCDKILFILAKPIDLFLTYGNSPLAPLAYANYGLILCGVLTDYDAGYQLGQVALRLLEQGDSYEIKAKVLVNVACLIDHWRKPIRETLPLFLQGYQSGLEMGDLEFAGLAVQVYSYYAYFSGMPLDILQEELIKYAAAIEQINQTQTLSYQRLLLQVVSNLMERSPYPCNLIGSHYNETETVPLYHASHNSLGICYYEVNKVILTYLFQDFSQALTHLGNTQQYLAAATGLVIVPLFYFYDSLVNLAIYPQKTAAEQEEILAKVTHNQAKMQVFAQNAPMNYRHKFDLVAAELCRVLGNKAEALELYDRAIAGAKENQYLPEEALANELAAKFYLDWGKEKVAAGYIQEAYYAYSRWGSQAKIADLGARYPQQLAPIFNRENTPINLSATIAHLPTITHTSNSTSFSGLLDIASAIKASQTLSSQMELSELLSSLMQLVLQNAGATKAALLLPKKAQLVIEAIACLSKETSATGSATEKLELISVGKSLPLAESQEIPTQPIYYAWHTNTTVMVNNSTTDRPFLRDAYLTQYHPASWLCTPLIDRGKIMGILYLENCLTTGAFTSDRLQILQLLSSQAAISIENARLYEESQHYAQQLEKSLETLKTAQLQLVQSEKMASLGQLVAGVAHEINNPLGFIAGNLEHAKQYIQDILSHLHLYQKYYPDPVPEILESAAEIELEYIMEDLPDMIASMKEGTDRIREISKSMRTFSRADTAKKVPFHIEEGIDSTLLILKHRLKASQHRPEIQIVKKYGNLPAVKCYPGQLNQVFMNLIANGIDALEDYNQYGSKDEIKANPNQIIIETILSEDGRNALIKIKDNARGMSPEIQAKIFDHLFTTKAVDKGTGLGLSISRQIVEVSHGGKITCISELGKGTEFTVALPLTQ